MCFFFQGVNWLWWSCCLHVFLILFIFFILARYGIGVLFLVGFFFLIIGVCLNFFLILLESFVEIAIKTVFHCELAVMGLPFLLIVLFAIGWFLGYFCGFWPSWKWIWWRDNGCSKNSMHCFVFHPVCSFRFFWMFCWLVEVEPDSNSSYWWITSVRPEDPW